jgi:tripartite-type tricarboxylate transporter receptor subunit TctC
MRDVMARLSGLLLVLAVLFPAACTAPAAPVPSAPKPAQPTGAAPAAAPAAPASTVSFQGKTVTIIVPYSPGGSSDIMTRLFAPTFAQYLPGNPNVVVQNMPGAGGLVGENWAYNVAPKDGLTILHTATIMTHALFDPEQVQYEIPRFQWLASVTEGAVAFGSKDLGARTLKELVGSGKHVFYGETSPASSRSMPVMLFLSLMGVDYTFVGGYGSSGDMRLALRRGELNMTSDALSGYYTAVKPLVEEGIAVPLAQVGRIRDGQTVRDPYTPDLPTWSEAAREIKGDAVKSAIDYQGIELLPYTRTGNFSYGYPPGVRSEVVAAVREAFGKAFDDPALRAGYEKALGIEISPLSGKDTQETMEGVLARFNSQPDVLERIRQLAKTGS